MKRKPRRFAGSLALAVTLAVALAGAAPIISAAAERRTEGTPQVPPQAGPRAPSPPAGQGADIKNQVAPGVKSQQPVPPSIPLGCSKKQIGSGMGTAVFGIFVKNTSGKPVSKIKWVVHEHYYKVNEGHKDFEKTGELVLRMPLKAGDEVKVAEDITGWGFTVGECEAVAFP